MGRPARVDEQHRASPTEDRTAADERRQRKPSRWGPARDLLPGIAKGPRKNILQACVDELAGPTSRINPGAVRLFATMLTPRAQTDFKSPWCDVPYQVLRSLADTSTTSFYRDHAELEEVELVGHENYAPGGFRREEREDGSVELVKDPSVAKCKKPKGGWIPSGRPGSTKVVPSCPECLWHHGGARRKVLVVSTRQFHLALEKSKKTYRVTPRDRARLLAVIELGHRRAEDASETLIADPHGRGNSAPAFSMEDLELAETELADPGPASTPHAGIADPHGAELAWLLDALEPEAFHGDGGIADPHGAIESTSHGRGNSTPIADPHGRGNSLSLSILNLNPLSLTPSRLKGILVEDDSPSAHRPDAAGPVFVVSPAPSSPPTPPQRTEPPRALARPPLPPAFDGFASRSEVQDPRSYESGGMQVVAIAPPSSADIERVLAEHQRAHGDVARPATPLERTAIAGALARGWSVEQLAEAARCQARSEVNASDRRRSAFWLYSTESRIQGCLSGGRKRLDEADAQAARRLAEEARRGAPPAPSAPDVGGIPIADATAYGRAEALKRAEAAELKARLALAKEAVVVPRNAAKFEALDRAHKLAMAELERLQPPRGRR